MNVSAIAPNQTVVTKDDGTQIFVSYSTPVAARIDGEKYRTTKVWSNTTTRHINVWLFGKDYNTIPNFKDYSIRQPQEFFDALLKG